MSNLVKYAVPEGEYGKAVALGDLHVNMSNVLVRAAHGLNLVEKRIITACISTMDSMRISNRDQYNQALVRLSAKDYGGEFGIGRNNAYNELKAASERLFERYVVMRRETPKGMKEHKFRWVSGVNTAAAKNKAFKLKYLNMIHALARSAREKVWVVV
jgi:plasmid replication initiation protein